MVIFHSYVSLPEGNACFFVFDSTDNQDWYYQDITVGISKVVIF